MTYTCTRPGCEIKHEGQAYCPTCTAEIKQRVAGQRLAQGTVAPCSCSPGACHGGHTINMGMPRLTDEHLRIVADPNHPDSHPEGQIRDMAAELLALRARVSSWSDRLQELTAHGAELDRRGRELEAAQREPIGYAVVTNYLDGRWVQAAPVVSLEAARARARVHAEHEARVVELREVGE